MYIREGWVIGNAGLLGGLLIVLLAFGISGLTALAMSSVTTNIRIGAGGAYSIISKSLGLEVAGSIGVPLYLAQAFAVSLYVFAFRAGWLTIFPDHPALAVDLITLVALVAIGSVSARLAFRMQYVFLLLVVASLVSVAASAFATPLQGPVELWGSFPGAPETGFQGTDFWGVFAVFFPAATGITAGANLSGELRDPRRSIPRGTMAAVGAAVVIYVLAGLWLAHVAPPEELAANYTVMVDRALWPPLVTAGLLGATFASALASLVGAPRILQALADHQVLPGASWIAPTSARGEPRRAMAVTAVIVLATLMLRDLNAVAPLISMFFLITYAMLNVVVLIEQSLDLVSFRPLMRVPSGVPLAGAAGCVFAMFIINPVFSLVAVATVLVFYGYLVRRQLTPPYGDVRSGLFVSVAEWAARRVAELRVPPERAWKPNLLVPVQDDRELRGSFRLIHAIAYPKGLVRIMGMSGDQDPARFDPARLEELCQEFRAEDIFASWTTAEADSLGGGVVTAMGAMGGGFFRPNLVLLALSADVRREEQIREIAFRARDFGIGVLLYAPDPTTGLGRQHVVNLWLRSPTLEPGAEAAETDLAILIAHKLRRNWRGRIRLVTVIPPGERRRVVEADLARLLDDARLPDAEVQALEGSFEAALKQVGQADIDIFGLPTDVDVAWIRGVVAVRSTALFVRGSGIESALA